MIGTCPWLVLVATGHPEPDFPGDLFLEEECGADLLRHPDYSHPSALICEDGHEFLPSEIALAPFGPEWVREEAAR